MDTLFKTIKKVVVTIIGFALLFLGVLGLFLPVLQGILFIILGLTVLSAEYHWPRRIKERFKDYFDRQMKDYKEKKIKKQEKKAKKAAAKAAKRLEKRRAEQEGGL